MTPTRTTTAAFGLLIALLCSAHLSAAPIVITDFSVKAGGITFDAARVGWASTLTLQDGQTAVYTQDGPGQGEDAGTGFNFDLSDYLGGTPALVCLTVNGMPGCFSDTGFVLTAGGNDGGGLNESHDWTDRISTSTLGWAIYFGYADTVHPEGTCATPTCKPSLFEDATYFEGAGSNIAPGSTEGHFSYDSAVVLIKNTALPDFHPVPEPATLGLLGLGLLGVGAKVRKRT